MRLFYTGASEEGGTQISPEKSVGGLVSGSPIPNDYLNNLFGDISQLTIDNNLKEVKLLALKNEGNAIANNVRISYTYPEECLVKVEVAFVAPGLDECGRLVFERISNVRSAPLYGTFVEPIGDDNAVNIGNIAAGGYVGIWFKRTLLPVAKAPKTIEQLIAENITPSATEEEILFKITWD